MDVKIATSVHIAVILLLAFQRIYVVAKVYLCSEEVQAGSEVRAKPGVASRTCKAPAKAAADFSPSELLLTSSSLRDSLYFKASPSDDPPLSGILLLLTFRRDSLDS